MACYISDRHDHADHGVQQRLLYLLLPDILLIAEPNQNFRIKKNKNKIKRSRRWIFPSTHFPGFYLTDLVVAVNFVRFLLLGRSLNLPEHVVVLLVDLLLIVANLLLRILRARRDGSHCYSVVQQK